MVLVLVMVLLQVGGRTVDLWRFLPSDVSGILFLRAFYSVEVSHNAASLLSAWAEV